MKGRNKELLILATSSTPAGVERDIAEGRHQRLDYLELARLFNADYVDYNALRPNRAVRRLERTVRLDVQQAVHAAQRVREQKYHAVLSMSERVGIPLSSVLDSHVQQLIIGFHLLSPLKLRLLQSLHILRRSDTLVVPTHAEAEVLRRTLAVEPRQVVTVPTWVDTDFFKPTPIVDREEAADHVLSVGLSCRDYPTLIHALRMLPRVRCDLRAGSSWVQPRAGYERESVPENVNIREKAHPSLLRACYQASRFVVLPVRQTTQWSAGGTAVLEAQAMGKAVIATRTPGMIDYIRDGETGILVDGGSPAALAEAIDYLWRNPEKADAMGRMGRSWVESAFSLERWLEGVTATLSAIGIDRSSDTDKLADCRSNGRLHVGRPSAALERDGFQ